MTPWLLLTALVAASNLAALIVLRGRWGRIVWLLVPAALLGTAGGEAIGAATGVDVVKVGDFHLVAASLGAQLAMVTVLLGAHLVPTAAERGER